MRKSNLLPSWAWSVLTSLCHILTSYVILLKEVSCALSSCLNIILSVYWEILLALPSKHIQNSTTSHHHYHVPLLCLKYSSTALVPISEKHFPPVFTWITGPSQSCPPYVSDFIFYDSSPYSLCSRHTGFLAVPQRNHTYSCLRVFALAVSFVWTILPPYILMTCSLTSLNSQLKHCFISEAFLDHSWLN